MMDDKPKVNEGKTTQIHIDPYGDDHVVIWLHKEHAWEIVKRLLSQLKDGEMQEDFECNLTFMGEIK